MVVEERAEETISPEGLPLLIGSVDFALGDTAQDTPGFIGPVPLGVDPEGQYYVMDPYLMEVHRFDRTGRPTGVVVRRGEGPGEIRLRPWTFGLLEDGIWYSELPTGRVHFVSFDGMTKHVEASGWTYLRLGAAKAEVVPARGWPSDEFIVRAEYVHDLGVSLRPTTDVALYRADGDRLDTIARFTTLSGSLSMDGGRSSVAFPAPRTHPLVIYRPQTNDVVRVDRPVGEADSASVAVITVLDWSGRRMQRRRLALPPRYIFDRHRRWIVERLLQNASFDGRRTLASSTVRDLRVLVDQVPSRLPVFDTVAVGPRASLWLRQTVPPGDRQDREWLIVDSTLAPVARAIVPDGLSNLSFLPDDSWWVTVDAFGDNPHVARLTFSTSGPLS